jgi:hypothetical protein
MSVQVAEASRHILIYVCVLFAEQQLSDPHIGIGSIAPNAARVLQQRMSVAPRKRQLATKVRRVVKGHKQTLVRCGKILYIRSPRTDVIEILSAQCLEACNENALNPPFHRHHRSDPHWSAWERYQQIKRNND